MRYFDYLPAHVDRQAIFAEHQRLQQWVLQHKKGFLRYRRPCEILQQYNHGTVDCSGDVITIGLAEELSAADRETVHTQLQAFMPWRKGPYSIFGIDVDAEWRSERKWQRLAPHLPELKNKLIADIGCSNGYYMYRMTPYGPRHIVGFEPAVQPYYCFKALNGMAGVESIEIDLFGVEKIGLFPECFDIIFLMGVIYHRSSPVDALKEIELSLKPGGTLILESQVIPGADPVALFPEKTYAKAPGTYFVPTASCLENWTKRAGFRNTLICNSHPMSKEEQRKTKWMIFESFSDFQDPDNDKLTIEGYPAPWRAIISAEKKR